ncbi:MAG: branched-chain amino acid ABC transporter permease [Methanophagales archaeon]|nr:branched-chain amino acid ABC transporter permease [Methanophagales archaeon]MCW3137636.1 branched-chain amino acid ABC transporter permease [Methanophagales archaeon]MCW7069514.1 branched-chain amino acid ABC transporter permease [Methanophagales archaeon]MCW7072869.1 branched-chain amino acid ABC transporter permease [Methanophagales archaeon]
MVWGLYAGCIYILLAIGLNLIFGVMKVVNFAHGELLMLGAYAAFWIYTLSGVNPYLIIVLAMILLGIIGVFIERLCFRPIKGTGKLNEIFLSLGLIYLFQNLAALLWTTDSRSIHSPYSNVSVSVGSVRLPLDYIIIILFTIVFLIAFQLFMKRTTIGRAMRATSQNRDAAALMGINVERMDMLSFALGSALAAAAGSLWLISGQIVDPYMGSIPAIKAFAVVIIGGLGSIPGAIVAGLTLGIAENVVPLFMQSFAGLLGVSMSFTAWKDTIAFFILIIVLVIKPTGIFGEKGE